MSIDAASKNCFIVSELRVRAGVLALKLGMSTAAYYGRMETEEAGALLSKMKLDCCEVFLETTSEYNAAFGMIMRHALGGLPAHSVHPKGTQFEDGLFGRSARQRADSMHVFKEVLAAGQALGASCYVYHGIPDTQRRNAGPDMRAHAETLRELCTIARSYGMRLAWENVWWCQLSKPAHAKEICDAVPDIGFVLDIKQALRAGADPLDFLPVMAGHLLNVHVCDSDDSGALCMPGQGTFDFARFFRSLREHGYDGPILLEPYSNLFSTQEEVVRSLAVLRKAME